MTAQEGDFDADTRFCVKWFSQFGWDEQPYGVAESLSKAVATSVDGLVRGGVFWARAGRMDRTSFRTGPWTQHE